MIAMNEHKLRDKDKALTQLQTCVKEFDSTEGTMTCAPLMRCCAFVLGLSGFEVAMFRVSESNELILISQHGETRNPASSDWVHDHMLAFSFEVQTDPKMGSPMAVRMNPHQNTLVVPTLCCAAHRTNTCFTVRTSKFPKICFCTLLSEPSLSLFSSSLAFYHYPGRRACSYSSSSSSRFLEQLRWWLWLIMIWIVLATPSAPLEHSLVRRWC